MGASRHPAARRRPRPSWLPVAIDVALAGFTFVVSVAMMGSGEFEDDPREIDGLGVLLALLTALPLLGRRRWPLVVFPLVWIPTVVIYSLGYSFGPPVGSMIALYEVAASGRHSRAAAFRTAMVVAGGLLLFVVVAAAFGEFPFVELIFAILTWGGSWYVGDRVRLRRERQEAALERVEQDRRVAVAEERTRIARDLHDSAGHAINVILVQAGAARLLQQKDPARARQALRTIEEVARETLGEIDRMVQGLRDERTAGVEPPSGLSALDGLAERHRAGGLDLRVDVRGRPRPLPPALDGTAYRILQEALTNAAVHGDGSALVEVDYGPEAVEITVSNPTGPNGAERAGGGHGIVGMRERASLMGGTLAAGASGGTFSTRARLPYRGTPE